ncbi:hypothetical protein VL15_34995 [Burkholderia cepacia]|uniref:Uncharacterized protein n=1 Tax=Burkholderia cepacia TaxID=292 RepID=A0A0J5ZA21_BURCE|nr:hypothetical protein VL15_34995 [Burkholderia cepacia]
MSTDLTGELVGRGARALIGMGVDSVKRIGRFGKYAYWEVVLRGQRIITQESWIIIRYGEVMTKGRAALDKAIPGVLERLIDRLLPMILIETLREQWNGLKNLDKQIAEIERHPQA